MKKNTNFKLQGFDLIPKNELRKISGGIYYHGSCANGMMVTTNDPYTACAGIGDGKMRRCTIHY